MAQQAAENERGDGGGGGRCGGVDAHIRAARREGPSMRVIRGYKRRGVIQQNGNGGRTYLFAQRAATFTINIGWENKVGIMLG